jgi:hypothetical protein
MVMVNDDPHGRRRRRGELARPSSMAGGSSFFPGLDNDESGSSVAGHGEQS